MSKIVKRSKDEYASKNKKKQIKINALKTLNKIRENVAGIQGLFTKKF
jgi:hypothetical protein